MAEARVQNSIPLPVARGTEHLLTGSSVWVFEAPLNPNGQSFETKGMTGKEDRPASYHSYFPAGVNFKPGCKIQSKSREAELRSAAQPQCSVPRRVRI